MVRRVPEEEEEEEEEGFAVQTDRQTGAQIAVWFEPGRSVCPSVRPSVGLSIINQHG